MSKQAQTKRESEERACKGKNTGKARNVKGAQAKVQRLFVSAVCNSADMFREEKCACSKRQK